jgi:hypothetical protein
MSYIVISRFGFLFSSTMFNINLRATTAHAVFTAITQEMRNSVDLQPHAAAALRCWIRTRLLRIEKNEFAAHEQPRVIGTRRSARSARKDYNLTALYEPIF